MQNLWNDVEADAYYGRNDLPLLLYSSRLLGQDPALVLHGGGNTSVKMTLPNFFGDLEDMLYIKGSGWDLATIQAAGFAPVRMATLLKMAQLPTLSDSDMVREQRAAMLNPNAPTPSVEAILHACIPFKYVDHTHADAVVAITNTPHGEQYIQEIYGNRVLVLPYIMPGFPLARAVYERIQGLDWLGIEGIILLNHGVFTFGDSARHAYDRMIHLVSQAEDFLKVKGVWDNAAQASPSQPVNLLQLAQTRKAVSHAAGKPMLALLDASPRSCGFSQLPNLAQIATQGTLTPDHIIRTKRIPMLLGEENPAEAVGTYVADYQAYFDEYGSERLTMLDPAPRYAIWRGQGMIAFGETVKEAGMVQDIVQHTMQAIQWAEGLGGWQALPPKDLFEMEYWELEQAKLAGGSKRRDFAGMIALVTGAASGIGRACVQAFLEAGAAVVAVDINPSVQDQFNSPQCHAMIADLTDSTQIEAVCRSAVQTFGGLDVLVSNAGIFPPSYTIEGMNQAIWDQSLAINLTSHQRLMGAAIPYLKHGINPSIIIVGSKNFPAPGPGAGAYSVAKAGVTQLGRIAALELAGAGIRVNVVHPDAVFDTGIWSEDILQKRAEHYKMSVQDYKTKNLLHVEITSADVATLVCTLASSRFAKTTGAQIPIDGGNDRVI